MHQPEELRKTPVYNALMRPRLTAHVDTDVIEVLVIITFFFVFSPLRFYYFPVVSVFIWFLFLLYAKDDPHALEVLKKYVKQGDYYEPWPHSQQRRNPRPLGFGRNELC